MTKPIKRILTIDGGGLRGVFSAAVIEQIEIVNKKPACEIFDAFVGTSAGSFIAAGLAHGKSAVELKNIFIELGQEMGARMRAGSGPCRDAAQLRQEASAALEKVLKAVSVSVSIFV